MSDQDPSKSNIVCSGTNSVLQIRSETTITVRSRALQEMLHSKSTKVTCSEDKSKRHVTAGGRPEYRVMSDILTPDDSGHRQSDQL